MIKKFITLISAFGLSVLSDIPFLLPLAAKAADWYLQTVAPPRGFRTLLVAIVIEDRLEQNKVEEAKERLCRYIELSETGSPCARYRRHAIVAIVIGFADLFSKHDVRLPDDLVVKIGSISEYYEGECEKLQTGEPVSNEELCRCAQAIQTKYLIPEAKARGEIG